MESPTKPFVIVDIDGVLADNTHRLPYILNEEKDWDQFDARLPYDTLHQDVAELIHLLWLRGYRIIMLTGRNERTRKQTELWLDYQGVPWNEVNMRGLDDRRSAAEIKMEFLNDNELTYRNVLCIFEDEPNTIEAMRAEGFTVLDPRGWKDYNDVLHVGGREEENVD